MNETIKDTIKEMSTGKNVTLWILSLIVMMSIYTYQKRTGPTYPERGDIEIAGEEYDYEFIRTWGGRRDADMFLKLPKGLELELEYKRFKSYDTLSTKKFDYNEATGEYLVHVPHLPPAGKMQYRVSLVENGKRRFIKNESTVMRFKGGVPAFIIYPHIFFMFFGLWISMRSGAEAIAKGKNMYKFAFISVTFLLMGAFVLGPIVQKYAFGEYWTGWPFGTDLTDNKVAIALLVWAIALVTSKFKPHLQRRMIIIAVLVQFSVFMIHHSAFGSELDFRKMADELKKEQLLKQENNKLDMKSDMKSDIKSETEEESIEENKEESEKDTISE